MILNSDNLKPHAQTQCSRCLVYDEHRRSDRQLLQFCLPEHFFNGLLSNSLSLVLR